MEVQDRFCDIAKERAYTLDCSVNWWGWVGGFIQYHYNTLGRSLEQKVNYIAKAILKRELHRDALLFTDEKVLSALNGRMINKAATSDKMRVIRYIGYAYLHTKNKKLQGSLEAVGNDFYTSIKNFSNSSAGLRKNLLQPSSTSAGVEPPLPAVKYELVFPEDMYKVFNLNKECSEVEKVLFMEKNLVGLPEVEREGFEMLTGMAVENEFFFVEFLKVVYANLLDKCFGSMVENLPEPLLVRAKLIQEWIKGHAASVTPLLSITSKELEYLPKEIGFFTEITSLDISGNKLQSIPAEIGALSKLESIDARKNKLKEISPEIEKCVSLKQVFFDYNELKEIPKEVWLHPKLEHISVSSNQIESLPEELPQKANFYLNATDNPLKECKRELLDKSGWSIHVSQEVKIIEQV